MIAKPPYGSECNACGWCCQGEVCPLGELLGLGSKGPCPALECNGERHECGLVTNPAKYFPERVALRGAAKLSAAAALLNGVGMGCDAKTEDEPDNPEYRRRHMAQSSAPEFQKRLDRAARAWGIGAARKHNTGRRS
jgi:hypothetical protein